MAIELGWDKDILILSDCQSACKDIESNIINVKKHSFIKKIRESINMYEMKRLSLDNVVIRKPKIVIGWIPSHCGIKGNELVDGLAKEATNETPDERIKVPINDWKRIYKEEMGARTRNRNETEANYKGKYYFDNHYKAESAKPWFNKLDIKRGIATMINRLRANHYNLNESLARKGYIDFADCECGASVQDAQHIAMECPQYDEERSMLYRELERIDTAYPYVIESWLLEPRVEELSVLWRFFKRIGKVI